MGTIKRNGQVTDVREASKGGAFRHSTRNFHGNLHLHFAYKVRLMLNYQLLCDNSFKRIVGIKINHSM